MQGGSESDPSEEPASSGAVAAEPGEQPQGAIAPINLDGMFSVTVSKKDAEIDRLSNQLSDESDKRKEEGEVISSRSGALPASVLRDWIGGLVEVA